MLITKPGMSMASTMQICVVAVDVWQHGSLLIIHSCHHLPSPVGVLWLELQRISNLYPVGVNVQARRGRGMDARQLSSLPYEYFSSVKAASKPNFSGAMAVRVYR